MKRTLVVDDDVLIANLVDKSLPTSLYKTVTSHDGQSGLGLALSKKWDIIILDITMPKMNGYDVCQKIRQEHIETPILFLTSEASEDSMVHSFNIGADDYITKPFSPAILLARVEALLKRPIISEETSISVGNLTLNTKSQTAQIDGTEVNLRKKEYELLKYLALRQGEFISKRKLLREIWNVAPENSSNRLEACIKNLKKALQNTSSTHDFAIENIRNMGYRIT